MNVDKHVSKIYSWNFHSSCPHLWWAQLCHFYLISAFPYHWHQPPPPEHPLFCTFSPGLFHPSPGVSCFPHFRLLSRFLSFISQTGHSRNILKIKVVIQTSWTPATSSSCFYIQPSLRNLHFSIIFFIVFHQRKISFVVSPLCASFPSFPAILLRYFPVYLIQCLIWFPPPVVSLTQILLTSPQSHLKSFCFFVLF